MGEIEKKNAKNAKNIKKQIVKKMSKIKKIKKKQIVDRKILKKKNFTYLYFCKRTFRNFQNSLIKSLILRIKHYKNFPIFLTSLDGRNRKKNAKNAKKIKKQIVNDRILKMFCIYNISIFLNQNSRIFENSLIKSIIRTRKHHKNV